MFFASTGDVIYRVSSQKAADLRRYFRRHHKTNRIDAITLAHIAILEGDALRPVAPAPGVAAELDRQVRVTERLTEEIAARKVPHPRPRPPVDAKQHPDGLTAARSIWSRCRSRGTAW
jgi:hypothetical protein